MYQNEVRKVFITNSVYLVKVVIFVDDHIPVVDLSSKL